MSKHKQSSDSNEQLQTVLSKYRATGRVAFYYPRKGKVSLNGGRLLSVGEAVARMVDTIGDTVGSFTVQGDCDDLLEVGDSDTARKLAESARDIYGRK